MPSRPEARNILVFLELVHHKGNKNLLIPLVSFVSLVVCKEPT